MKKTVNQLGEKDKLEIKKLKKQSTKKARKASWKSKNRENSQPRGKLSKLCLAVACCMREYERMCLVRFDKIEKKC